jgi:hypothetical protein
MKLAPKFTIAVPQARFHFDQALLSTSAGRQVFLQFLMLTAGKITSRNLSRPGAPVDCDIATATAPVADLSHGIGLGI